MGFISSLAQRSKEFPGQSVGESLWRRTFGTAQATDKEEGTRQKPVPGGAWGRSTVSSEASIKRLLQALRSMAPGGWSDDRWEQTRHFTGITYASIHRSGEQLLQSEFQVFHKDEHHPDGKRPVMVSETSSARDGPQDLVHLLEHPNNEDSFGDLLYRWNQQLDLTGMALTWMVPNQLGNPYELYPIPTAIAIPQPAVNPDYPDGFYRIQPVYPYGPFSTYPTPSSAVGAPIPAQWMLRFKYPHPLLRYEGYSPLSAMRLHIDEVEMMDRSRFSSMRRSINPSAVLQFRDMEAAQPLPDAEIERIRAEFEADFQGPENHGRLYVTTPGAELEQWGVSPKDMDYPNGWEQLVDFIMGGGFGTPKSVIGMLNDMSYSTLFASIKMLHLLTLQPKVNRIAAGLTRHLAPFFGNDLIIEIRCPRIDDHELKNAKLDKLQQGVAITKNELRKELDMPLTTEAWGGDMAGDPSPQAQAEMQQQMQQPMEPGQGEEESLEEDQLPIDEILEEETEELNPPDTGTLGEGSLGPRKMIGQRGMKSNEFFRECDRDDEGRCERTGHGDGKGPGNLQVNVWKESDSTPWFWEVYDADKDEEDVVESGTAESEKDAKRQATEARKRIKKKYLVVNNKSLSVYDQIRNALTVEQKQPKKRVKSFYDSVREACKNGHR